MGNNKLIKYKGIGDVMMYKSFEIKNFRCFPHLKLDNIERVNLIAGKNNVGKTALLEALYLHSGIYDKEEKIIEKIDACYRDVKKKEIRQRTERIYKHLFSKFDISKTIELVGEGKEIGHKTLKLRVEMEDMRVFASLLESKEFKRFLKGDLEKSEKTEKLEEPKGLLELLKLREFRKFFKQLEQEQKEGIYNVFLAEDGGSTFELSLKNYFRSHFLSSRRRITDNKLADLFGNLRRYKKQSFLLDVLKLIELQLNEVTIITIEGEPKLYGDMGLESLVPLSVMGDGMFNLTAMSLLIANAENGVVLIDEIENGIHYSVLPKMWKVIDEAARKFNVQIFVTTHSLECIKAAHQAFKENAEKENGKYDFRLYRLQKKKDGSIKAVTYDQEGLAVSIDTDLEVR